MGTESSEPVIGLSCRHPRRPDALLTRIALRLNGARVVLLRPGRPVPWGRLHGLVIGGGAHIHPRYYGAESEIEAHYVPKRDEHELALLKGADEREMPVLGICRGAQALNVSRRGALIQDITPMRRLTRPKTLLLPLQPAHLQAGSRLARVLQCLRLGVNRIHSQAMESLGDGLHPVAWDADGFIQAIERRGRHWQLGVQWHPEYLFYHPAHRRLFIGLVRAAKRYQQNLDVEA
jgi:putative glutamine amidotransferase